MVQRRAGLRVDSLTGSGSGGAGVTLLASPAIVSNMVVGIPMSVTPGVYLGTVSSRTYQWKKAGVVIAGATSTAYTGVSGDAQGVITCEETVNGTLTTASASVICAPVAAAYSTALAAVADGQYFTANNVAGTRARIYKRTAGAGVLYDTTPANGTVNAVAAPLKLQAAHSIAPVVKFDAIDVFYGETEYQNRVPGAAARQFNLLSMFQGGNYNRTVQGTVTMIGRASDSLGGTRAIRAQIANGATAASSFYLKVRIPPGQWTLAFEAQTTGQAATQSILFSYNSTTSQQTANLTASWQTFSQTVNLTSEATFSVQFCHGEYPSVATVARDFAISGIRLIPGAAAGSSLPAAPNLGLQPITDAVMNGYQLEAATTAANGNSLHATLDPMPAVNGWSFMVTVDATAASTSPAVVGLLTAAGSLTYAAETQTVDNGDTIQGVTLGAYFSRAMDFGGAGLITFGMTTTSALSSVYVNGVLVNSITVAAAVATFAAVSGVTLWGGSGNPTAGFPFVGDASSGTIWNAVLTAAQMAEEHSLQAASTAAKGLTMRVIKNVIVGEGDSITNAVGDNPGGTGGAGGGFVVRAVSNLTGTKRIMTDVQAINGSNINALEGRQAATTVDVQRFVAAGIRPILTLLMMTNDDTGLVTQAQCDAYYLNHLIPYWAAMRTAGAKVVACTGIPNNRTAGFDATVTATITATTANAFGTLSGVTYPTYRRYLNALIMQHAADAVVYDGVADLANATGFSDYATSVTNGVMNADVVHPTQLGHHNMALVLAPVMQTLLAP